MTKAKDKSLDSDTYAGRRKRGMFQVADELLRADHSADSMYKASGINITACREYLSLMEAEGYATSVLTKFGYGSRRRPRVYSALGATAIARFKEQVVADKYPSRPSRNREPVEEPIDGFEELFRLFFSHIWGKPKETLL